MSAFVDEVTIKVRAGAGGDGCLAFRREAHVPRGGPSGGNGGKGGDVYLVADLQINTLNAFSKQIHFGASSGEQGRGKNQTGAQGADLLISVPIGTIVYDGETGVLLADIIEPGQRALIARGIDELVAGTRALLIVRLFGEDIETLKSKADEIARVLSKIEGATDLLAE